MDMEESALKRLLQDREESERRAYREEAQESEAAKFVKITGQEAGVLLAEDLSGRPMRLQNVQGTLYSTGTTIMAERAGPGWQAGSVAPYANG